MNYHYITDGYESTSGNVVGGLSVSKKFEQCKFGDVERFLELHCPRVSSPESPFSISHRPGHGPDKYYNDSRDQSPSKSRSGK